MTSQKKPSLRGAQRRSNLVPNRAELTGKIEMTSLSAITGPAAWRGCDIDLLDEGARVLTAAEIDEIDAALARLHALGDVDFPSITPETFPLPTLAPYLGRLAEELRFGRG